MGQPKGTILVTILEILAQARLSRPNHKLIYFTLLAFKLTIILVESYAKNI